VRRCGSPLCSREVAIALRARSRGGMTRAARRQRFTPDYPSLSNHCGAGFACPRNGALSAAILCRSALPSAPTCAAGPPDKCEVCQVQRTQILRHSRASKATVKGPHSAPTIPVIAMVAATHDAAGQPPPGADGKDDLARTQRAAPEGRWHRRDDGRVWLSTRKGQARRACRNRPLATLAR
jgi:hypothetical protein